MTAESDVGSKALLGDDYETFEAALSGETDGPLAVIGPPYSGRGRLLDRAAARLGAARVDLGPGDGVETVRPELGDCVVVGNCQQLYRRVVGGFEKLDSFLDAVATASAPVVTGWNRYAWAYLTAVQAIERVIPHAVAVGPVATEAIAELILGQYAEAPSFADDTPDATGPVRVRRYSLQVAGYTVSVPLPVPNGTGSDPDRADPQDVVFERLAAASEGNVGVARALWQPQSDHAVRPSDIAPPDAGSDLDRDAAFCLRVILAKERVQRAELASVVGEGVDRILGEFRRDGLVAVDGTTVVLAPAAVPTAAEATERERIL